jgi:cytochrome P450
VRDSPGFLQKISRKYGDVVAFRMGLRSAVLINSPALIERVVKDRNFVRSTPTREALASFLGRGLLSLEGSPHLRHRRLMQPAFHRERIKRYGEIMARETYATLSRWQDHEPRDLRAEMMRLTFNIVSRSLFDEDGNDTAAQVDRALQRIQPSVIGVAQVTQLLPFAIPAPYFRATRDAIQSLKDLVLGLVERRRRDADDRGDLLSMLLSARDEDGSALSDADVCAELLTILFAGHETTAHTMTWAWHLLSQRPALQDALAREVHEQVGARELRYEDLTRLGLADRVVRETMRLYPAAWWADRICDQAVELGGHTIPANTTVVFSVYVTHRDARYFADPERFDPDRFSAERAAQIPEGAYLPFGAGVHMCIGNTFALQEARMILAAMAQRFQLQALASERVRPQALVTLGMAAPFPVKLTRRASFLA